MTSIPVPNPATVAGKVTVFVDISTAAGSFATVTFKSLTFAVSTASLANLAAVTILSPKSEVVKAASAGFVPTYHIC